MISLTSIIILFAEIAMAAVASSAVIVFIERLRSHPKKRFFYTIIIIGFVIGATEGFTGFLTTILFILQGEKSAILMWKYHFFATPLFNLIHWITAVYLFTKKKHVWHNYVLGVVFLTSAVLFAFNEFALVNNSGIISVLGLSPSTILFGIENIVIQIALFLYIYHHRAKLIKKRKPIGYVNVLLYAFAVMTLTYITVVIHVMLNYAYPLLFVIAWVLGTTFVFLYLIGYAAIDDKNEMLLHQPFLIIKRSISIKLQIILNLIVWFMIVGGVLIITTLLDNWLQAQINYGVAESLIKQAVKVQAWFLLASTLVLIATIILVRYFTELFLKPLQFIKRGAKLIGEGNLDYRITTLSKDELGRLAADFNEMAAHLQKKNKEIVRLKELDEMKSQFVSIASHQLRTPLTSLRWSLSMLLKDYEKRGINSSKETLELFTNLYDSTKRMINLVNNLLDATKLESEKIQLHKTSVFLDEIIKTILNQFQFEIEEKEIRVSFLTHPHKFPAIAADKRLIEMAITNLIGNAIHYNKKEGLITIEAAAKRGYILLTIKDTGIGIKKSEQANLFTKFYRGHLATALKTEGSGLGLFIAHLIVEAHKGKIWFESKEEKGTIFYIQLPK